MAVADVEGDVLGHLVAIELGPDGDADLGRRPDAGALAADLGLEARQCPLGRGQELLALAGPLVSQQGVAAAQIRRSPGNCSGALISAMSRSSNSES